MYVQTPRSDIFVVMLGIALGAILLGCLLLVLLLNRYGFQTTAAQAAPATPIRLALAGEPEILFTVRL